MLNGYLPLAQQGGRFRHSWRQLPGSDTILDQEHVGGWLAVIRDVIRDVAK